MSYPNDNFAAATALTGDSGSITAFHYDGISDPATSETGEAVYGAGETLWWKWTATFDGVAFFATRNSPSDDGDSSGLDTKIRVFSDFTTILAGNDDDPDPPSGSYDYNSYVEVDVTHGQTYYVQTDMYGSGEAGTLHVAWGAALVPGAWITSAPVSSEDTLIDTLAGSGRTLFVAQGRKTEGTTWTDIAETAADSSGVLHYSQPPLRPTYSLFSYIGEPGGFATWADAGADPPPDEFTNELNPFDLDWTSRLPGRLPAPPMPPGAIGWEFEGYPRTTYGTSYRPFLNSSWVTASSIRALLEVNRTAQVPTPTASADPGWTWITPPVAGVAGPQTIEFRHDGPGLTTPGGIVAGFTYNQQGDFGTTLSATTIVDDTYAIYSYTFQLGDLEIMESFDAGLDLSDGVHWGSVASGWHDYARAYVSGSIDARAFSPEPLTVQIRLLDLDPAGSGSTYQSGTDLGAAPLLYEQSTTGALNETIDTGWIDLDVTGAPPRYLYLNYAEQVSHTSPEPATLPARDARHFHGLLTGTPETGTSVLYGSTVSFERPGDGSTRHLGFRLTYQAPRVRFFYPGIPTETTTIPPLRQVGRADRSRQYPRAHVDGSRQTGRIP